MIKDGFSFHLNPDPKKFTDPTWWASRIVVSRGDIEGIIPQTYGFTVSYKHQEKRWDISIVGEGKLRYFGKSGQIEAALNIAVYITW